MLKARVPTLSTQRLVLNAITQDDHQAIYRIFSSPEIMQHYDMEPLKSPKEGLEMLQFFIRMSVAGNGMRWAIRQSAEGELIGTCGFNSWNSYDHSAIIGYDFDKPHWGQGFGTEVVAELVRLAFSGGLPVQVNRIEASVLPSNKGSEKVLFNNGFSFEGRLREKGYWAGAHHDMNLYSLLAREYRASAVS